MNKDEFAFKISKTLLSTIILLLSTIILQAPFKISVHCSSPKGLSEKTKLALVSSYVVCVAQQPFQHHIDGDFSFISYKGV